MKDEGGNSACVAHSSTFRSLPTGLECVEREERSGDGLTLMIINDNGLAGVLQGSAIGSNDR